MESSVQSDIVFASHSVVVHPPSNLRAANAEGCKPTLETELDHRLAAVLRGLCQGFACDGAEFYTVNAANTELALRASYRAAACEPSASRRLLANARADVAAMAGNAIVLEDDVDVSQWSPPAWCGAAICLPVASNKTIHGTMWLYNSEPRSFADAEVELAEVVAGRLALEIELEEQRQHPAAMEPVTTESALQPFSLTRVLQPAAPALEDWEIAGWITDRMAGHGYYDWQTFSDRRTLVAVGSMLENSKDSAALHSARIALRAHAPDSRDAGELLTRVNHTLWMASPGGEGLALAVALLDSDGAHASVAMAGAAAALRWRASTCELLPASSPPAGWSEQSVYVSRGFDLVVRERLVLITAPESIENRLSPTRLARDLGKIPADELRTLPGKRALRRVTNVATANGAALNNLALVRRR